MERISPIEKIGAKAMWEILKENAPHEANILISERFKNYEVMDTPQKVDALKTILTELSGLDAEKYNDRRKVFDIINARLGILILQEDIEKKEAQKKELENWAA
jgi:hypothetical protein